ncbi:exopolysaccharide biosynthesis WecB/TagA/CpsF family protein [Arcticibacter pallidicorallinus]|uniref:Exopolysaccharide biosynthesis WecB/TagA/CpsF family protein n=1 Tax=Arcticibacter pallidicorallinus TaxID=1259464 RepID=A0A2T0U9F9_9SPHI|nr:WecB/TagA/CpsF family glycosyltransferase [Arcticibacter pallidicorallinus]PRY54575.1 exopolysaccharide biosynthesis WecB/TagA/CpsF family protein [Arcticibacter pallidicorallinus]
MKILLIHTFYGQSGGEDQVFRNECDLLSGAAEARQLCFDNGGKKIQVLFKFILGPFNLFSLSKFRSAIKADRPDVIHIHNWHFAASPILIRAAKKLQIPVVVTLHNYRLLCPSATLFHNGKLFTESLREPFPWKAIMSKVYRNSRIQTFWLAAITHWHKRLKTWQGVDRYIALNEFSKDLFLKSDLNLSENQIDVKANFVTDGGWSVKGQEKYYLFVGRLSPEKGIPTLLAAFSNTEYELRIVGDGPLRKDVERFADEYKNISYLGSRSNEEIRSLMKSSMALVFPSIWYEGMPMTILEAFSTGTCVIGSRLGAMESLITHDHNGYLFTPGDIRGLRSSIAEWEALDQLSRTIRSINARKTYETHYTPEENLDKLLSIYRSAIGTQASPVAEKGASLKTIVMDFPVFNAALDKMQLNQKTVINTINQYSYVMTTKDPVFKEALMSSDVLLPDGVGITIASSLLNGIKMNKIAGAELHEFLLTKLQKEGGSCFYLGSSETTLLKIRLHVNQEFPSITVHTFSPPFKKEFSEEDNRLMIEEINRVRPDVLFIGMTAPKQEKWAYQHYKSVDARVICAIGAVFDFYAGTVSRPSQFWIDMRMEWLVRLVNEPGRMWKRYLYYGPYFVYILISKKLKKSLIVQPDLVKQTKSIEVSNYTLNSKKARVH